jgi:hypothetical protein
LARSVARWRIADSPSVPSFEPVTVVTAIGVLEANARSDATRNQELATMRCSVMRAAERDQVVGVISATFGT